MDPIRLDPYQNIVEVGWRRLREAVLIIRLKDLEYHQQDQLVPRTALTRGWMGFTRENVPAEGFDLYDVSGIDEEAPTPNISDLAEIRGAFNEKSPVMMTGSLTLLEDGWRTAEIYLAIPIREYLIKRFASPTGIQIGVGLGLQSTGDTCFFTFEDSVGGAEFEWWLYTADQISTPTKEDGIIFYAGDYDDVVTGSTVLDTPLSDPMHTELLVLSSSTACTGGYRWSHSWYKEFVFTLDMKAGTMTGPV